MSVVNTDAAAPVNPNLCTTCKTFDVQALLVAAENASQETDPDTGPQHGWSNYRAGIPRFFQQHTSLTSLKASAPSCEFCASIWQSYVRTASPAELTDDGLMYGLGSETIWIGTTPWDTSLMALPQLAAFQYGEKGVTRTLGWFEVCVERGK